MKIGEWDGIGRARGLIAHQLGELGAQELAAHVTADEERARHRIMVATDIGLLDYSWSASSTEPDATWSLRGGLVRWPSVKGLRLQTDGEFDPVKELTRSIWRLVAEEPRIELSATDTDADHRALSALLTFARACLERTG
ncbi:MAG: hypothetical protein ACRDGJ_08170 [Candidatus Limnocylindria bacterium]